MNDVSMREKSMSKIFLVMLHILFTRKMIYVNVECPPYEQDIYTRSRRNEWKFFSYAAFFCVSHDRYFWANYSYRDDHISYAMERPYIHTFISYFRCLDVVLDANHTDMKQIDKQIEKEYNLFIEDST
jgi:hypothetical protein